jgi:hypothetical protein
VLSLGASSAALIFGKGMGSRMDLSWQAAIAALLAALVFFPVVIQSRHIKSPVDQTGERMIPARIQAGQVLAVAFWLLISFWRGFPGLISVLPVGAAALGAGSFYFIRILKSP